MASAVLTHPASPALAVPSARRVERRRWPETALARWGLRLALASPYLALATWLTSRQVPAGQNLRLESSAGLVEWGSRDLGSFIGSMYPPAPIALASLLPGGANGLGFVGALTAGVVLHLMWERLHEREVPGWLIGVLLVGFGCTPAFAYLSVEDLSGFVGLGLFAVALAGFLRFAAAGDTEGGFVCGLALGVAVACDAVSPIYAACLGVAAPFVAWHRYRGEPRSARASALVIAFPAMGALGAWTFLQWRFTGSAFGWLTDVPGAFEFEDGVWAGLGDSFRRAGIGLVISPVFVLTQVLLVRRRREALLVASLPLVGTATSLWLGLRVASGHTVVLLGMIALMSVPRRPTRPTSVALAAASVLGLALVAGRILTTDNLIHEWVSAVL
jgi:hypothetical protein